MLNIKRLFITSLLFFVFFTINTFSQEFNKMDENGKRTGVWKKYYANGKLRYEGQFLNGKEVGTFKFYSNRSNIPQITKEYSSTSGTALVKFYTKLGQLKTTGKMIGKKRVGKWTYFFPNGSLFSEEHYKDGKLDGLLKNYYSNGKTTNATNYKNGLKDGVSKTFTDDGILIEEVTYTKGKLNGPAKFFDLKGNLTEKGVFENGKRKGKWEFYIDGQLSDKRKREKFSRNEDEEN